MGDLIGELLDSAIEGLMEGIGLAVNEGMNSKSVWTRYIIRAIVAFIGIGGGIGMMILGSGFGESEKSTGEAFVFLGGVLIVVSIVLVVKSILKNRRRHHDE